MDSNYGRFTSRDPHGIWGDPVNIGNPYTYCGNNPINMSDPSGEFAWFIPVAIYVGWQALNTAMDVGVDYAAEKTLGDGDFSASDAAWSTGINFAVNLATGGIGGKLKHLKHYEKLGAVSKLGVRSALHGLATSGAEGTANYFRTGETTYTRSFFEGSIGNILGEGLQAGIKRVFGNPLKNAKYAQRTYSEEFGFEGRFSETPMDFVTDQLRKGVMDVNDVPIDYYILNKMTYIINTRSGQALERAGIPRKSWKAINRTGDMAFERRLRKQLERNNLKPGNGIDFPMSEG